MAEPFRQRSQAFVVRLWPEADSNARWRGQVEHVGSGETAYFQDAPGLLAALEHWAPAFASSRFIPKEER